LWSSFGGGRSKMLWSSFGGERSSMLLNLLEL
jgi:hypothetical protein